MLVDGEFIHSILLTRAGFYVWLCIRRFRLAKEAGTSVDDACNRLESLAAFCAQITLFSRLAFGLSNLYKTFNVGTNLYNL
jgi:hypothetical protein